MSFLEANSQFCLVEDTVLFESDLNRPKILVTYDSYKKNSFEGDALYLVGEDHDLSGKNRSDYFFQSLASLDMLGVKNLLRAQAFFAHSYCKSKILENQQQRILAILKPVLNSLKFERDKVKGIYQDLRESNTENFQSLTVNHYHKVGISDGSEYLRSQKLPEGVLVNGVSTDSYHEASLWMTFWENSKGSEKVPNDSLLREMTEFGVKGENLSLCMLNFEASSLELTGHIFGDYYLLSSNKKNIIFPHEYPFDEGFYEKAYIDLKLERGERLILLSPGTFKAIGDLQREKLIKLCLDELSNDSWRELADKVIIELSSNAEYDILDHDMCLTVMEVSHHAIFGIS